jgi:hypothetical protein
VSAVGQSTAVWAFKFYVYLPALEAGASIHHVSPVLAGAVLAVARRFLPDTLIVAALALVGCVIHIFSWY